MERNNLKNLHTIAGRSMKEPINVINNSKVRDTWEYCTSYENQHGGDLLSGYLWNPRSYTCSFCKREFRSAQALGGHMNVHRRDRARLRQYPSPNPNPCPNPNPNPNPLLNLNLNPSPNLNLNHNPKCSFLSQSSHTSANYFQITANLPPIEAKERTINGFPCQYEVDDQCFEMIKCSKTVFGVGKIEGFRDEIGGGILENEQVVKLDLEIGLISGEKESMNLDLELRLGRE